MQLFLQFKSVYVPFKMGPFATNKWKGVVAKLKVLDEPPLTVFETLATLLNLQYRVVFVVNISTLEIPL